MSKGFLESLCEISHLSCLQSQSELQCRVRVNFSEGVRENFFETACVVCLRMGGCDRDNSIVCIETDAICFKLCLTQAGQTGHIDLSESSTNHLILGVRVNEPCLHERRFHQNERYCMLRLLALNTKHS